MPTSCSGWPRPRHGDDVTAPVAALGGEALVAEHVGHQLGEQVGDLADVEARLAGPEREP